MHYPWSIRALNFIKLLIKLILKNIEKFLKKLKMLLIF